MRTICDRIGCLEQKHRQYSFCLKHHRLSQMARAANAKYVSRGWERITGDQVERLFVDSFPDGNVACPVCNLQMLWTGDRGRVISIQHNNVEQTLSFLCLSCNTRAGKGDPYFPTLKIKRKKKKLPTKPGKKRCPACLKQKSYSSFHRNKNTRDGYFSRCKQCRKDDRVVWRWRKNR